MKRGLGLVELLMMVALAAVLLIPLLTLSLKNVEDPQDLLERSVVQNLCLDMVERFKAYKPFWPLPGTAPKPPSKTPGAPVTEMFLPVELDLSKFTLFDKVYVDQLKALGITPKPKIELVPDTHTYGLFRLNVSIAWTSLKGHARQVDFSRYCYQP
jgi:hypothetical protein